MYYSINHACSNSLRSACHHMQTYSGTPIYTNIRCIAASDTCGKREALPLADDSVDTLINEATSLNAFWRERERQIFTKRPRGVLLVCRREQKGLVSTSRGLINLLRSNQGTRQHRGPWLKRRRPWAHNDDA